MSIYWGFWDFLFGTRYNLSTSTERGRALEEMSMAGADVYSHAQFSEARTEIRGKVE